MADAIPIIFEPIYTSSYRLDARDHFALAAMQAFLTRGAQGCPSPMLAKGAYDIADAMLAERAKKWEKS